MQSTVENGIFAQASRKVASFKQAIVRNLKNSRNLERGLADDNILYCATSLSFFLVIF